MLCVLIKLKHTCKRSLARILVKSRDTIRVLLWYQALGPQTEYFKVWSSEGPFMPRRKDSCGGYQKLVQESINRRVKHGRERSSQGNWVHLFMYNWNLWVFPEKSCCNLHPPHSLPSVLYYVLGHFYFIINLTVFYFIHSFNLIFYIFITVASCIFFFSFSFHK